MVSILTFRGSPCSRPPSFARRSPQIASTVRSVRSGVVAVGLEGGSPCIVNSRSGCLRTIGAWGLIRMPFSCHFSVSSGTSSSRATRWAFRERCRCASCTSREVALFRPLSRSRLENMSGIVAIIPIVWDLCFVGQAILGTIDASLPLYWERCEYLRPFNRLLVFFTGKNGAARLNHGTTCPLFHNIR